MKSVTSLTASVSFAAGAIMPFLVAIASALSTFISFGAGSPKTGWIILTVSGFVFALGLSMWRPISPSVFGAGLAIGTPACVWLLSGSVGRSDNMFGLVLILYIGYGVIMGVATGLCGSWLRRRGTEPWITWVLLLSAIIIACSAQVLASFRARSQSTTIRNVLPEIQQAEQFYSAGNPDHAFTCNGPDLSGLTGIEWSAPSSLGVAEKKTGKLQGYTIYLECPASAYPQSFTVTARPSWNGGPVFMLDSAGHLTQLRNP